MRMLLKLTIPVDKGNAVIKDGSIAKTLEGVMNQLKSEAAYFLPQDGQGTALFVFDMAKPADLVPMLEPFWIDLEADVEISPVMNFQHLQAGMQRLQH